jgi:hypothetical protein
MLLYRHSLCVQQYAITRRTVRFQFSCFFMHVVSSFLHQDSGIKMIVTDDLEDAANKAVKVANIVTQSEEAGLDVAFTVATA